MKTADELKAIRERRERLFRRTNPRARSLDFARDAWVLWAAYDLASFPALKKSPTEEGRCKTPEEFFTYFRQFAASKSSILMVDADHRYFREKRGPVAMVSVENNGWRIEPQFDFFHWATPRHRLAAAVGVLNMVRYAKDLGACLLRVAEADEALCQHIRDRYALLHFVGKFDNGRTDGDEYLYSVPMKRARAKVLEMKRAA